MLGASPVQSHPLGTLTCTYTTHATHGNIHTNIKKWRDYRLHYIITCFAIRHSAIMQVSL